MGRLREGSLRATAWLASWMLACAPAETPAAPTPDPGLPLEFPALAECPHSDNPAPASLVVATWNMGAARSSSMAAVQAQLEALDADVVLLQEVDVGVLRTDEVHQAAELADALGYDYVFAASIEWDGGVFGLTTLSRLPVSGVDRVSLDGDMPGLGSEARIALDVRVCSTDGELRFVNVHADFKRDANANNLAVLGALLAASAPAPTLVGGDFNTAVDASATAAFLDSAVLIDIMSSWDTGPTRRRKRIDFLFGPPAVADRVVRAERVETSASDHRPLVLELGP